jgi:hypothetical protein
MGQTLNTKTDWTINDVLSRESATGETLMLANTLSQERVIFQRLPYFASNEKLSQLTSKYTSLGAPRRGRFNKAYRASKSSTIQQRDTLSWIRDQIKLDPKLERIMGDRQMQITGELGAKTEIMGQQMENDFWYGPGEDDYMLGVSARLNSTATRTVHSAGGSAASNADGSTNLSSVYCLTPSIDGVYFFYPKAFPAGLEYANLGTVPLTDAATGDVIMKEVHNLDWTLGDVLANELRAARLANIDVTALSYYGSRTSASANVTGTGVALPAELVKLSGDMQNSSDSKRFWVAPRKVMTYLKIQQGNKDNVSLTISQNEDGSTQLRCDGLRVDLSEQLGNEVSALDSNGNTTFVAYSESHIS